MMADDAQKPCYILELHGDGSAQQLTVCAGDAVSIGRSSRNRLVVKHALVSRRHAVLHVSNDGLRIVDLNSPNGTFVDGTRLVSGGSQTVQLQSEIGIGPEVSIRLRAAQPDNARPTATLAFLTALPNSTRWGLAAAAAMVSVLLAFAFWLGGADEPLQAGAPRARVAGSITLIPTFTPLAQQKEFQSSTTPEPPSTSTSVPLPTIARPPTRAAIVSTPAPMFTVIPAQAVDLPADQAVAAGAAAGEIVPAAEPPAPVAIAQAPAVDWDPRLDALGVRLERADASSTYWRLVRGRWEDEQEAGGTHNIYVDVLDEAGIRLLGQPVIVTWGDGSHQGETGDKPAGEYPFNYPMYAAGHAYSVRVGGLPSDLVNGVGMGSIEARGMGIHTSFRFTFQRTNP
jgi:pSer/pThr/pTyr-binding forkhead associated (FHA) protein